MVTSVTTNLIAGIKWVDVGVNGLTCSMCTRSVEMSLRKLDFVDSVAMSLEAAEGRIYLRGNTPVNFERLAKAVVNAGFSVRFIRIQFSFEDIKMSDKGLFTCDNQVFKWINYKEPFNKKPVALKLIDEGFLPKKEAVKWKKRIEAEKFNKVENVLHVLQED